MMDGRQFDKLTQMLARGTSRRRLLRGIATGLAAGPASVIWSRRAAASPAGKVGICHLTGDPANPVNFITVSTNAAPAHAAHGDVIDPDFATDPSNCGGCGIVCTAPANATATCSEGECDFACVAGFADCDLDPANGCETPLGTDTDCGACDDACDGGAGEACEGGACTVVCKPTGEACFSSSECCSPAGCSVACTSLPCADVGESCTTGSDCCQKNCVSGICVACIPDGEPCNPASLCCSWGCSGGLCGVGFACFVTGGSCTTDKQCCDIGDFCVGTCL